MKLEYFVKSMLCNVDIQTFALRILLDVFYVI